MNQILKPELNLLDKDSDDNNSYCLTKKQRQTRFFLLQFLISSSIATCFLFIFFIRILNLQKKEALSDELMKSYQISTLYSDNTNYLAERITSDNTNSLSNPFVIGMIKIDKINLNYPILSESNKELLNISVCRFAGPMPNEIGNLCIAGHNYVDYKFFSRLHELEKNDKIKIYGLNGEVKEYIITKKYESNPNDISCTSQNTNGKVLLTLLTCNNVSGKRLVLTAKPI